MSERASRIRRVASADVGRICELVRDLAEYERAPTEATMTEQQLDAALFGPRPSLFGHVAEVDGSLVGFAVWFRNFSTWRGRHGIYLEDLFVAPEHRGSGIGKALLTALARECMDHGYPRLEWSVLDWNAPSIAFYRSLGAIAMEGWTVFRLTDDALAALATSTVHSALEEGEFRLRREQ